MRPSFPHPARLVVSPRRARLLFVFLTLFGLVVFAAAPGLKRRLGLNHYDLWFADSYAVLAASDAHRAGLDPALANPLDVFARPHIYTDWWYALGPLGLTREDNFLVGAGWIASFLIVTWLTLRPATGGAALFFTFLVLSPPVLLAVNRANNDLVIFVHLGLAALALDSRRSWNWLPALALIALATGLKFYPVAAAAVFFLLRPRHVLLTAVTTSILVLALVLHDVLPALSRGQFHIPPGLYTLGAAQLLHDLGIPAGADRVVPLVFVIVAGVALSRRRITAGLAEVSTASAPRVLFLLGAVTLTACWLAGASFGYRWIFSLWLAPWLSQSAGDATFSPAGRRLAAATGWLLLALLWLDGAYCLVTNSLVGRQPVAQVQSWQHAWRLVTQPLAWIFFALLAGWIADAFHLALRTVRAPALKA